MRSSRRSRAPGRCDADEVVLVLGVPAALFRHGRVGHPDFASTQGLPA